MKNIIFYFYLVLMVFLTGSTLLAQEDFSKEVIVYFSTGVQRIAHTTQAVLGTAEIRATLQKHNVRGEEVVAAFPDFVESDTVRITSEGLKISQPNLAKIFKIRTANTGVRDALIQDLKKLSNVLFAEPNGTAKPLAIPNDQYFGRQSNLHNTGQYGGTPGADIKATEAWDIYTGTSSNIIAIVDGGIDETHPDLSGKVSGDAGWGWNGHGIHVAGIASAKTNDTTGVAGVDWNAQLHAQRIDYTDDAGTYQAVVDAVNYSANVRVLNNSWGLYPWGRYSTTVRLAFSYAYKMNRVAAAAMGNNYAEFTIYPAGFGQGIIAVGATTVNDSRAPYSNTGNHIDVAAPGGYWVPQDEDQILSTYRNGDNFSDPDYYYNSGTSMATPHVSGIASLLKGYNPSLFNDDIENIIKLSADDIGPTGWDHEYGYGRVNALKALRRLRGPFTLTQSYIVGGTDQGASSFYQMTIYGAQALGLPDGTYWVRRHEVRQAITYPTTRSVAVWGRGVATNGWADEGSVNFTYGWCEPVTGTVTSTGATLRTFVYEVYDSELEFLDCYPTTPSNVRFEYTVHGIPATITSNTTWEGEFSLDGSVTVNSGVTLTINAGTSISFASGASLTANGTLYANGASGQPITFTSQSGTSAGSWGSIVLSGSGANGSSLNYVTMEYGTQINVLDNAQNITIQNSTIQNTINGIYAYNATGSILNNTITNVRDHGINLIVAPFTCNQNVIKKTSDFGNYQSGGAIICQSGSSGNLWQNDISGYNWGIGAIWGSSPQFRNASNNWKNNRIKYCLTGVEVYQQSYPTISYYPGAPYWTYYTGNSISSSTYYNVYFTSGGTLFAEFTYWGGPPTPSMFYLGYGCSIDSNNWLSNDPWNPPPAPPPAYNNSPAQLSQLSTRQDIVQSNPTESLFDGIELRMENKHKEAKDFFISYIAKHPDDQAAYVELYNCYNDETAKDIMDFFTSLPKAAAKEHELLLSYLYVKQGNVNLAEQVNSKVIGENPNTPLATKAKINNFYIALYNENDVAGASAILNEVLSKAELSTPMELSIAQDALEAYGKGGFGQPEKQSASVQLVQSGLAQNFPNPFNPLTTIAYRVTRPGKVSLKVFDLLGREVATLVNAEQEEGTYTQRFDASHLSSGIYFYRLLAPGVNETRKMLIAK